MPYAASKAFVSSLARSLRLELEADNIGVSDMIIGQTQTEFSEKRLGQSGRSGGGIPVMPVEKVAEAIVRSVDKKQKRVVLRWLDRLFLTVGVVAPHLLGRMAMRQYK